MHSGSEKIKVLYIAGAGRSGSTVLAQILGQIEGFFNGGEIRLWARGFLNEGVCECGSTIGSCEVWNPILNNAFGSRKSIVAKQLDQMIHTPLMLVPWKQVLVRHQLREYLRDVESIYRAIRSHTGCRVIIDPSKFPFYGRALDLIGSLDVYVLHLIRDPRAVAFSWQRKKTEKTKDPSVMVPAFRRQENPPVKASIKWIVSNVMTEFFWKRSPSRYLMIRYEDFIVSPRENIKRILALLGEEADSLPFFEENQVVVRPAHSAGGNPGRFRSGVVELKVDNVWMSKMSKADEMITGDLTWPLLVRYGYPVRRVRE
jgi:hypothetical protein